MINAHAGMSTQFKNCGAVNNSSGQGELYNSRLKQFTVVIHVFVCSKYKRSSTVLLRLLSKHLDMYLNNIDNCSCVH